MKLTLDKLVDFGMSISFKWYVKRIHPVENSSGRWEERLEWEVKHGTEIKFECKWEGFLDYESALSDLLSNAELNQYYNDILEKRQNEN